MLDDQSDKSKTATNEGSNQTAEILSGIERSLAVTCDSIMDKMRQLEDKIQSMENRYTELAKDAQRAIQDAEKSLKVDGSTNGVSGDKQQSS